MGFLLTLLLIFKLLTLKALCLCLLDDMLLRLYVLYAVRKRFIDPLRKQTVLLLVAAWTRTEED